MGWKVGFSEDFTGFSVNSEPEKEVLVNRVVLADGLKHLIRKITIWLKQQR